jgi:hypothetical protein
MPQATEYSFGGYAELNARGLPTAAHRTRLSAEYSFGGLLF